MANQAAISLVQGQGDIAPRTAGDMAAAGTQEKSGVSPAAGEEDGPLPGGQGLHQSPTKPGGQKAGLLAVIQKFRFGGGFRGRHFE
jgi:hypothetical protein